MILIRIFILVVLLFTAARTLYGQSLIPQYNASQCATAASNAFPGVTDGRIVAVAAVGASVDIGAANLFMGMNLTDGKSPLWLYMVYSPSLDSAIWVPLIRTFGSCTAPPVDVPTEGVDVSQIGTEAIPGGVIEGTAVVNAIKGNSEYVAFNTAHPDSLQLLTVLTVSTEPFLTYPTGTPFWMLTWMNQANPVTPFFCVVHAVTGQTVCFGGDVSAVHESTNATATRAWPNPASDVATLSIPSSAIGKPLFIEAFSPTGERIVLLDGAYSFSEFLPVPTHELANGVWYVRVSGRNEPTEHASTHIIIQR